jgi:hypothetical protein
MTTSVVGMSVKGNPEIWEDVWVKTTCGGCYGQCTIRAHRVNGVIVKINGEPDNDFGPRGGICAKGEAMIQALYDPNRYNYPLRRTNPKKGIFEDPKWERISWDEALDEIAGRPRTPINSFTAARPGRAAGRTCLWDSAFSGLSSAPRTGISAVPDFTAAVALTWVPASTMPRGLSSPISSTVTMLFKWAPTRVLPRGTPWALI